MRQHPDAIRGQAARQLVIQVCDPLIDRDDVFAHLAHVERLARGLGAKPAFRRRRELTLLAGQIEKGLPGGGYINIDVLSSVHGDLGTEDIAKRSILSASPVGKFRVMHPLDVLQGRLENVYGLAEKRDEHIAQLQLAIAMVREFLGDIAPRETAGAERPGRPVTLRHLRRIEALALSDAGRKLARRYNVHVADAIDPAPVSHLEAFVTKKLPQLLKLMSPARRAQITPEFTPSRRSPR